MTDENKREGFLEFLKALPCIDKYVMHAYSRACRMIPPKMLRRGEEFTDLIEFTVSENGEVTNVKEVVMKPEEEE